MQEHQHEVGTYSIVIVGAMNPRIHHPLWYKMHGFLTESEADAATDGLIAMMPNAMQFKHPDFQISCTTERWDISTEKLDARARILDLARRVFDEKLRNTPTGLIGFNNVLTRKLFGVNVPRALGKRIAKVAFGIDGVLPNEGQARFTIDAASPGPTIIQVLPGLSSDDVVIAVNTNHPTSPKPDANKTITYFEVAPILARHFDADLFRAREYADTISASLAASGEGQNAS